MEIRHKRHEKFPFTPEKAALLVIDMQDYFTNKDSHAYIESSADIIPKINRLAKAFHGIGRPVIFTRHIDVDMNNLMNRWWEDSILEGSPTSQLNSKIDTRFGITIIKHQYDAFLNTELEGILRREKTTQLVITGVATHLCCETTARSSFMRDFETFFVVDATGDYEKIYHEASIINLAHGFAIPTPTQSLLVLVQFNFDG